MSPRQDAERRLAPLATSPPQLNGREHQHRHQHIVQLYGDDSYLLDRLARFVGSALTNGGAAVLFLTPAHRVGLESRLLATGVDPAPATAGDRYLTLDAATILEKFVPGGQVDTVGFRRAVGAIIERVRAATARLEDGAAAPIAVFGELVTLLCQADQGEVAVELEGLWSELVEDEGFDLLCAYPLSCFEHAGDADLLGQVCATHGQVIPAESYTALDDEEARARIVALLQQQAAALAGEVAERERAQRSLRRRDAELADFLENALEGVLQLGADQTILWANRAMLRLLDYAPDEYIGQPLDRFAVRPHSFDDLWQRLLRHEDVLEYPAELRCRDGAIKYLRFSANGFWDNGRLQHARCFARDVTEQLQMEQALLKSNRELRAALAARERFLSNAAHELKTPITSLRAYAQLLLRDLRRKNEIGPERLAAALDAIEAQTSRLTQLITRLLDTASVEAGRLHVMPVRTDLVALVERTVAQHYHDDGHRFIVKGPERLEATVDGPRLEQVITNLLNNAVKYSPGGGMVTVELAEERERVTLAVSDQGIGIPLADRERIFERFHHSDDGDQLHGMGIGLYLTREIVRRHGGSIRIEGPEWGGTRVVVTLPKEPVADEQDEAAAVD